MWVGVALSLAALAFVPDDVQPSAQFVIVMALTALFCLNCLHFSIQACGRDREQQLLAACLLVFLGAAVHDLLLLFKRIDGLSYIPYTSIAVLIGMSAVQGLRHARSVRRIERFNEELEISVQRARDELAVTLAREHELALAHSRLQDRLDIARDLHDGLGGSLVRMTALVEQSGAPLQNRQFLSMLNLLRNDLRQTIDSGASADMKPPATPREWIAPLRHRYTQLFDELGIEVRWDVPASWIVPPSALQCLALTRLIEEGLTNVIKHSRAGRVAVRLAQPTPGAGTHGRRRRRGLRRGRRVPGRHQRRHAQHVHAHRPGRRQLADRFRARPHAPDRQPDPGGGRRRGGPGDGFGARCIEKSHPDVIPGTQPHICKVFDGKSTTIAVIHKFQQDDASWIRLNTLTSPYFF